MTKVKSYHLFHRVAHIKETRNSSKRIQAIKMLRDRRQEKKSSLEEANQILQQLLSRQVQVPSPVQVVEDEIACLMHCYAVTMKTFPPLILARVKRDIGAIVSEAELQTISNSHNQIQVLDEIVLSSPANAIEDEKIQIDMHGSDATFGMVIHPTETDGEIREESFHYTFIEENHEQDFF